jgi:hypothetical protein
VAGRDLDVIFYNPAQIIGARPSLDLSVTRHGSDGTTATIGSAYAAGPLSLTLGFGAQVASYSTGFATLYPFAPDVLMDSGPRSGVGVLLVVGGAVTYKGWRMGAAGKYAADHVSMPASIEDSSAGHHHALLLDVGAARNLWRGVAALSVQNLGRASIDEDAGEDAARTIPRQVLLGWSTTRPAGPIDVGLYSQLTLRDGWTAPGGGVEVAYSWIEGYTIAIRAGARRVESASEQPVALGAAFTADRLTIEYALQFFEGGHTANGVTVRWR